MHDMLRLNPQTFITCVALAKAGLVVGPVRLCPSAKLFGSLVCVMCNSKFIQTLHNGCSNIEDVHFHKYFLILLVLDLDIFSNRN